MNSVLAAEHSRPRDSWKRPIVVGGTLLAALVVAACASLFVGLDDASGVVLTQIRLPRLVMAIVGGAALGSAGLLLQEGFGNRLAVPEILGVSSGSAAVTCAIVVIGLPVPLAMRPVCALCGGITAGVIVWWAARQSRTHIEVLLIGTAVSSAAGAMVLILVGSAGQTQIKALLRYLQGSLNELYWPDIRLSVIGLLVVMPMLYLLVPGVNVMRLGDSAAQAVGASPAVTRGALILSTATVVALCVAPAGPLAWVGFLGPLLARMAVPQGRVNQWLPFAGLSGALITVVGDWIARTAFAPMETPVGGWTGITAALIVFALACGGRR